MFRIRDLKFSFIWFYLFGQTAFIPSKRNRDKFPLIISIVPKAFLAFVVVNSATNYVKCYGLQPLNSRTAPRFYLFTIVKILPHMFSIGLQLRKPFASKFICKMFANSFQSLNDQLKIKTDLKIFLKKFHKKIILNVFISLAFGVIKFLIPTHDSIELLIFFTFPNMYRIFIVLHITLFVDLIQFFLFTINTNINYAVRNRNGKLRLIGIVDSVKKLHLSLWNISNLINSYFGLILVVVLLHDFTFATLEIYWTFLVMENIEHVRELKFIRNYSLLVR